MVRCSKQSSVRPCWNVQERLSVHAGCAMNIDQRGHLRGSRPEVLVFIGTRNPETSTPRVKTFPGRIWPRDIPRRLVRKCPTYWMGIVRCRERSKGTKRVGAVMEESWNLVFSHKVPSASGLMRLRKSKVLLRTLVHADEFRHRTRGWKAVFNGPSVLEDCYLLMAVCSLIQRLI